MFRSCALLLAMSAVCWAADVFDIKPGLWEFATTIQMSGTPPIPNFDQLTPEQRARVEAAMKGMNSPRTNTNKACVTREGIEKAIARANSNAGRSCEPKLATVSASKVEIHLECNQPNSNMRYNGDITILRKDLEHFTGSGTVKSSGGNGSMETKWSMTGKFVASDCGDIKPAQ